MNITITLSRLKEMRDAIKIGNETARHTLTADELLEIGQYQKALEDAWGHRYTALETVHFMVKDLETLR